MSRFHPEWNINPILEAVSQWKQRSLMDGYSLFGDYRVWTEPHLDELVQFFVENPDEGEGSFLEKLGTQLEPASPGAHKLAAEIIYILLLCSSNIGPEKKRENIVPLWESSGDSLGTSHPLLADAILVGVGSTGTGYNNHRWRELAYAIRLFRALLRLPAERRRELLSNGDAMARWLEEIPENDSRQFRHIFLFMVFPDDFERIFGGKDRIAIVSAFNGQPEGIVRRMSPFELDKALRQIRAVQAEQHGRADLDFYIPPLLEVWQKTGRKYWLLPSNPNGYEWDSFSTDRAKLLTGSDVIVSWPGVDSGINVGDSAFILRTSTAPKGIVARGNVVKATYQDAHWDPDRAEHGETTTFADIQITDLRDPATDAFISVSDLETITVDNQEWNPGPSGVEIRPRSAKVLDGLWDKLHRATSPKARADVALPAIEAPRNVIFYGPPGTGKTYELTRLVGRYEERAERLNQEEWLQQNLDEATWAQVVFMALLDVGEPAPVGEIIIHPYFQAKAQLNNRSDKNLRATCWSTLQSHTLPESTTVQYALEARRPPYIFDKNPDGTWFLAGDWRDSCSDWVEDLERIRRGSSGDATLVRRYEMVTFHQSYSYEDFVEGIRPRVAEDGRGMTYEVADGVFKRLCTRAKLDPRHRYALFIDEINRGNVAKILGELITLIESDKRTRYDGSGMKIDGMEVRLPYSGELFGVPRNLDIFGAMNTADRSIAPMDAALRRRFQFKELLPDPQKISGEKGDGYIPDGEGGLIDLRSLLQTINARVEYLVHRDQTVGHAFFMKASDFPTLRTVIVQEIIPQLQEYFYNDWSRIQMVFGDAEAASDLQIVRKVVTPASWLFGGAIEALNDVVRYEVAPEKEISPDAIRKVYQPDA